MTIDDNNSGELSITPFNTIASPEVAQYFREVSVLSREAQRACMDTLLGRLTGRASSSARSISLQRSRLMRSVQTCDVPVPECISLLQIQSLHATMNGDPRDASTKALLQGFLMRMEKLIDMNKRMSS